jgi:hypothetical protein
MGVTVDCKVNPTNEYEVAPEIKHKRAPSSLFWGDLPFVVSFSPAPGLELVQSSIRGHGRIGCDSSGGP